MIDHGSHTQALGRLGRWRLGLVILAVTLLAYIQLWAPFSGDQALFTLIGEELRGGRRLYGEIWDIKQPGIFYFYLAAGTLFSFDEVGVHLLEFVYLMTAAVVVSLLLRQRYSSPTTVAVLPLLWLGTYYTVADANLQTQVESLIGPIVLSSIFLFRVGVTRSSEPFLLAAGAAAGVVGFFKLLYIPIPLICWWVAAHRAAGQSGRVRRALIVAFAGTCLTATLVLALHAFAGTLGEALRTWLIAPFEVLQIQPRPPERLIRSVLGFGALYLPSGALALYSAVRGRRKDWLSRCMWTWVGLGAVTFAVQKWHVYLALVISLPLVILAADGLDALRVHLTDKPSANRSVVWAAVLVTSVVPIYFASLRASQWVEADFATSAKDRAQYQVAVDSEVESILREAATLRSLPMGSVLVFGDPRITYYADRRQSGPYSGWSWTTWTARTWRLAIEHWNSDPPSSIFISRNDRGGGMLSRVPELDKLLNESYVRTHSSVSGVWYTRVDLLG
jgi:hypothetical protein